MALQLKVWHCSGIEKEKIYDKLCQQYPQTPSSHLALIRKNWDQLLRELPNAEGFVQAIIKIIWTPADEKIEINKVIEACKSKFLVGTFAREIIDQKDNEKRAYFSIWAALHTARKITPESGYGRRLTLDNYKQELESYRL